MPSPKIPYVFQYRKPGTIPPVYLAGSFTDPAWEPREMASDVDHAGLYTFSSAIMVEPGKDYQFKLRMGQEQDWVLADEYTVVTDDSGNQNNLLRISSSSTSSDLADGDSSTSASASQETNMAPDSYPDVTQKDETDFRAPLFAHECLGAYDFGGDNSDHEAGEDSVLRIKTRNSSNASRTENIDINDPTLQKFPSDRTSILDAIRTIQTHLGEDHATLDNMPQSPRFTSSRRTSLDSSDSLSSSSTAPISPITPRRRDSRPSHSSFGKSRSAISLGSIAEEPKHSVIEEPKNRHELLPPHSNNGPANVDPMSPTSEEDESIVMHNSKVRLNDKTEEKSPSQPKSTETPDQSEKIYRGDGPMEGQSPRVEVRRPLPRIKIEDSTVIAGQDSDKVISESKDRAGCDAGEAETKRPANTKSTLGWIRSRLWTILRNQLPLIVTAGVLALAVGVGRWKK